MARFALCLLTFAALTAHGIAARTRSSASLSAALSDSRIAEASEQLTIQIKWWPFGGATWGSEEKKPLLAAKPTLPPVAPKVADAKKALLATAAFKQKTAALCAKAPENLEVSCENVADERLFCAMFSRHEQKFVGMEGEQEEKEKCKSMDIMETVVDAAKDAKEQEQMAEDAKSP
eukprot:gnl/TRDRNA2_/TRDRNA2_142886_c0_seq1.p1 gnl/TRDRNA2_/TRDRNA2_142886_c0~~gnl/TRDRNA2_/TRDRNA2_142886_c0_seq1.p1  ORF type:complete len:176 (-),score=54.98 gnl/TRDRNA2_/TRDRNA2_142886_c0_seq1:64-591(-)